MRGVHSIGVLIDETGTLCSMDIGCPGRCQRQVSTRRSGLALCSNSAKTSAHAQPATAWLHVLGAVGLEAILDNKGIALGCF